MLNGKPPRIAQIVLQWIQKMYSSMFLGFLLNSLLLSYPISEYTSFLCYLQKSNLESFMWGKKIFFFFLRFVLIVIWIRLHWEVVDIILILIRRFWFFFFFFLLQRCKLHSKLWYQHPFRLNGFFKKNNNSKIIFQFICFLEFNS